MEYSYIIAFNLKEKVSSLGLLRNISNFFSDRNIKHQGNINTDLFFLTNYQGSSFKLTIDKSVHFEYAIRVRTDYKIHTQSISQGFIKLIWDMLTKHMNVSYGDLELFEEGNFRTIDERYNERLISRKSMCDFLDNDVIEALPVQLDIKEIGIIKLTKSFLKTIKPTSFELAWYSFSLKLDYDGWYMTTAEFVPLTLEEYQKEIEEFTDYWKELSQRDYGLLLNEKPISIIRTSKGWDYNEYLIKYDNKYQYIGTDIYTG